jgi:CubicO group peptidase (beta-lactamase class C family)
MSTPFRTTRPARRARRVALRSYSLVVPALVLALATPPTRAHARQAPPDAARRVDHIFEQWSSVSSPGCAVGVAKDGVTVLERAYGMADLEHDVPNTPETIFEGGSLSKQFTAGAVVLLALEGKLSLDDDVRTYVPEVPDYGHTITLRHLMTHTSGLRDWGSVAGISGWGRESRTHTHDHVLDIVSRQSALNFEPGHEYSYSNTGFNLLAIIVGRVSGMPFAEFSRERIFEPLGMRSTQWRDDYRRIVKGRSSAYTARDDGTFEINRPIEDVHGNGGILSTVGDLLIWTRALADGRLGGPDFVRMMHEQGRLSDGSRIVYAGGLRVENFAGVPSVTHTGSTAGYRAFLGRYPDQDLAVAMLCNVTNVSTGGTGGRIARMFLGDHAVDPEPPAGIGLPAAALRRLAGLYRDPVTGSTVELRGEGGTLRDGGTTLIPLSETTFARGAGDDRMVFDAGTSGRPGFTVESWQYTSQRYEPVEPWTPAASDLEELAGTYHSDDAETTYVVRVEDGRLTVWQRPDRARTLSPMYRDGFRTGGNVIRFRRDGSGNVSGLSLSLGRVYDMRFERVAGGSG